LALDSKGSTAGKPVRLTNTVGMRIGQLSASANGERVAVAFGRECFAIFVANLNKAGDKLENPVRLTPDTWENFPAFWTPDSETIFYKSLRDKSGIYRQSLSSESAQPFLSGTEDYSIWGVSADRLWYFVTAHRPSPAKRQLLRVPVSGGAPELILEPEGVVAVHCATGRWRICVLSETVGSQIIFAEIDPLKGRMGEIARTNVASEDCDWSLSPDASRIALVNNLSDNVQILDLRSKQVSVIHPIPALTGIQRVSWSAESTRLFVTAMDNAGTDFLTTMDLRGQSHVLLQGRMWFADPRPSPDGKRIAYIQSVSESNVTLLEHF
jgi:Tol biopolymer transport system component